MRIAFLVKALYAVGNPANGIVIQARSQAKALANLGHEVVLLNPWQCQEIRNFDVIQFFAGGLGLAGVEKLSKTIGNGVLIYAPIIDANESNLLYRVAAGLGGIHQKLITVQGEYRKQALASDAVVCRSAHEQERVIKGLGIPRDRTAIVLNGVDNSECPSAHSDVWGSMRERWGLRDEFVLHVSRYTGKRKNVTRLIEAVGPLGHPLVIAGWAEPGAMLERLALLASKYPQISLLGFLSREELLALYAHCRVFCLPSLHEGTGLVALEAAAYGAKIVITRNGGPTDYLISHAYYVDPYSISEIQKATARAWDAPRSDSLQRHVVGNLTWEQSAKSLLTMYEKALARKLAGPPFAG
jgi:glycosyltransferase involved in cell wall biosynthesis